MRDKTALIRQLVPKSYHFDGYNEINCQNSRDKPFFTNNAIKVGKYTLTSSFVGNNKLSLNYQSVCPVGKIIFEPYVLSLDEFIKKLHQASKEGSDFITFSIKVKVIENDYKCRNCIHKNNDCVHIMDMNSISKNIVLAAVSFNPEDIKEALAYYFELLPQKQDIDMNGGFIMNKKNNFLGLNFEYGISTDPNIASTLMGVAIRNPKGNNFVIYDNKRNKLTDIANMKLGNMPILLLPTKELKAGTLTKQDSKYYFVNKVNDDGTIVALEPATGEIKNLMLKESLIPGLTFYTQVIAMDPTSLTNLSSNEDVSSNMLAAICMMNWSKKDLGNEFSLDSINDDSFNGLGQYLPLLMMNMGSGNSQMNKWSTLMLLNGAGGDDAMQMFMLSQLLDGKSPFENALPATASPTSVNETDAVMCKKCNKHYPADTKFCPTCGEKTVEIKAESEEVMCTNCHKHYAAGTNFCPTCGIKTVPIANTCKACGAKLSEGAIFCQNCGAKVVSDTCPNCGCEVESDQSFCIKCGTNLKAKPAPKTTTNKKAKKTTKVNTTKTVTVPDEEVKEEK